MSLDVSPRLTRHGQRGRCSQELVLPGTTSRHFHQGPRNRGRTAHRRGGNLCRRAGQRDLPVLSRALPGGGRGVSAGCRRRIAAGLRPNVGSVASLFVSCWDVAVNGMVPETLHNQLGLAMAKRTYKASLELARSKRWKCAYTAGARPQRLLWTGTETNDPEFSEDFYIKALAAPFTVSTMSESTLKAFADHGDIGTSMPVDGGDCEAVLSHFSRPAPTSMPWQTNSRTNGLRHSLSPGSKYWR